LILSGDQLYQMDYRKLMESHRRQVADVTVAVTPVTADQAHAFGILKVNKQGRIVHFDEKPPRERLDGLVSDVPGIGPTFLASMGIYMFGRDLMVRTVSDPKLVDFGRHIIPKLVPEARVHAYVYRGYWEDVGTIQSYYDANLALCQPVPPFDFYDTARPVYSNPRFLPATKIEGSTVENALVAEGSVIVQAEIRHALVGIRARIGRGDDTVVRRAIIDKNARIGRGVRIVNEAGTQEKDGPGYFIREGIVIVPKNAAIPDGTVV
jgi:glucose-1-phosphate adenylyltransferase